MTHENMVSTPDAATYRSGIAGRLAGVPVETLRVWERRYGVVGPRVSPRGQRLYSSVEIRRLALIKQMVDAGHRIGAIAALSTDALIAMRAAASTLATPPSGNGNDASRELRVVLVGSGLSARRLEENLQDGALKVVGRCVNVADAARALHDVRPDIAVIEMPTLNDASLDAVENMRDACGAGRTIVLYRFAPSQVIRRLRAAGHAVARAPSDAVEIASLCRAALRPTQLRAHAVTPPYAAEPSPPRFDERALSELAGASTTVYCECPRHLVELVLGLGSFERFSEECASRGPDDAALHRDLQQTAARARAMMEDALLRVALAEGLPIPPSAVLGS